MSNNPYQEQITHGEELYQQGQIDEALQVFEEVLENDPENVEALNDAGVVYTELNEQNIAKEFFNKVLEIDNANISAFYNVIDLLVQSEDNNQAKFIYDKYRESIPTSEEKLKYASHFNTYISRKSVEDKSEIGVSGKKNKSQDIPPSTCNEFYEKWLFTEADSNEESIINYLRSNDWSALDKELNKDNIQVNINEFSNVLSNLIINESVDLLLKLGNLFNQYGLFRSAFITFSKASVKSDSYKQIENFTHNTVPYDEEIVTCDVCGIDNEIYHIKTLSGKYTYNLFNPVRIWRKCKNCGLLYVSPRPAIKVLPEFYKNVYRNTDRIKSELNRINHLTILSRERLEKMRSISPESSSLLDIGGGIGIFASTANDMGYESISLDVNKQMSNFSSKYLKLRTINSDVMKLEHWKNKFCIITAWETIEHLASPFKTMKKVAALLKPSGVWAFATPVCDSTFGKLENKNGLWWVEPGHLFYFSIDSIKKMLNKSGFQLEQIRPSIEGMGRMEFYATKIK